MATTAQAIANARSQLRRLDGVIRDLEQAGQDADAKAVRVARELAERALADNTRAEPPRLLTTRQAGRALGVSIQTIRNWVAAGRLRAEQRGIRTMIPHEAVVEEIERSRARPSPGGDEAAAAATLARRQRLLAGLPPAITAPLNALHDKLEGGEPLTPEEQRRMVELESEMIDAAARTLANDRPPNSGNAAA